MNTTPQFYSNLWGDLQGNIDTATWTKVQNHWQNGQYLDTFYTLLDYINPALRKTFGNSTQTQFKVPHGSVVVDIQVSNNKIDINCPMVDISSATKVPLLRKAAEINFYPLNLAQLKLNNNQLSYSFSSTLDTCEPYKIYYVLKEICTSADRYDDEFSDKFKAKSIVEPKIEIPPAADLDKAWENTVKIIDETFQFIEYFDSQRWQGSSMDFVVIALKRIDLCTQVQGFLKTELERAISDTANNQVNFNDRLVKGKAFLQGIKDAGKDAFIKNVYKAETFIPEKWRTSGDQVKENIKGAIDQTQKYHNDRNFIASVIESLYLIYDLFYKNNMDNKVNDILKKALADAGGKSWEEASPILLGGLTTIQSTQF